MSALDIIGSLKTDTFETASAAALAIRNAEGRHLGRLIPVGPWILTAEETIQQICDWRQKAMRMFLTQFDSTYERTYRYLSELSVGQPNRLLFLIHDSDDRLVGHVGIAEIDGRCGELDNLMRGVDGGDPRLIFHAEVTILDFCFSTLGLTTTDVRTVSYNWMVISLHQEVGFEITANASLRKHVVDGFTVHDEVGADEANVKYSCTRMLLHPDEFYRRVPWLADHGPTQ